MNRGVLLVCALALVACTADVPRDPSSVGGGLEAQESGGQGPVNLNPAGEAPLVAEPTLPHRARQRLNIDQLGAAIVAATGGIPWTETAGSNQVDLLSALSATLGKPDYAELTTEDLDASALFHKFLDDASRHVCTARMELELADPDGEGALMIHAGPGDGPDTIGDGLDLNLQALLLRYHGRHLDGDHPALVHWRWLWTTVATTTQQPALAWRSVCVALITHPDFYSY